LHFSGQVGALGDRGGPDGDLALRRSMADVMATAAADANSAALLGVTQRLCWLRRNTPALRDASAPTRVLCNTNHQMAYARVAPDNSQVALVVRTHIHARAHPSHPRIIHAHRRGACLRSPLGFEGIS
jgi:hypothetical protein